MSLSNYYLTSQDVRTVSTKKGGERFGQVASTTDGRTYAYGFNNTGSGTALAPNKLCQGALTTANHVEQTGVVLAAGVTTFTYTIGNTAITANQYQDGYFMVTSGTTPQGSLLINNHNTPSGNGTLRIELKDPLLLATTTSSKFTLQPNLWSACLISASSGTSVLPVGVPNISIPDQNFGWFQVQGECNVLINGTPALASQVIPSATTAGAVDVYTNASVQQSVGYTTIAGVSTKYYPIMLTIPVAS